MLHDGSGFIGFFYLSDIWKAIFEEQNRKETNIWIWIRWEYKCKYYIYIKVKAVDYQKKKWLYYLYFTKVMRT